MPSQGIFAPESSVGTRISLRRRRLSVTGVSFDRCIFILKKTQSID